ncbi:hypothetical protein [Actinophytocola algeriensis]|uniref:Uncharacterized protein n=1 Tax=Actinophytocola algeriensis TaxID=1768010 RepID=A0A7W7Q014_9PSEU|nr:hypothetical protein [Actinophytocola algeriensis]MBB4904369.1 hypothetical protein [Actinophytocola algeriensis]MBE1476773.1 hypothetical protein [Actinophytocola algeriensis]
MAVAGLAGVALPGVAAASSLEFHIRHQFRPFDLIAPGFVQYDVPARPGRVVTGERPVAPFCAVVTRARGAVAAGLAGGGTSVLGRYADGTATIEVTVGGATTVVESVAADLPGEFGFAVVVNENAVTVLADTGAGWQPLLTNRDGVRALIDLRDPNVLRRLSYGYEGAVGRVRAGYFGQAGVRDPHVVQHADGRPFIRDGKLYLTLTNAGLGFFQQAHWGVWTLDLANPTRLTQVAQLFFARDGVVLGDHAGQIVVDGDEFVVAMSSWGDFNFAGVHIRYVRTRANVLSGVHVLPTRKMPLPTTVSSWDPAMTKINGQWHVAFVESPAQSPAFVFHPALARGRSLESLSLVGADLSLDQTEGTIIQRLQGKWYVLTSDGDARVYRKYDLSMRPQGTLDAPYGTNIPHPMVFQYRNKYWMVTFDGTQYAEPVLGYGGHGDFIVMTE